MIGVSAVTAPFHSVEQGEEAARALRRAGFSDVRVDRIPPDPEERGDLSGLPLPRSLTGGGTARERFLGGSDEAISGLSAGELVGEAPYQLTVVIAEGKDGLRDRALHILRRFGADVGLDNGFHRSDHWDAQASDR